MGVRPPQLRPAHAGAARRELTAPGRPIARLSNRIGVWLYRRFDGRVSGGNETAGVLMITIPGRRSGVPHSSCLRYLDVPTGYVVWGTGSGSPTDPDWFRNLRAAGSARVKLRHREQDVRARELVGLERDAMWQDVILARLPEVERYARKAGRTIPVALLEPTAPGTTTGTL